MRNSSRENKAFRYIFLFATLFCIAIAVSIFVISYKKHNGKSFARYFDPPTKKTVKSPEISSVKYGDSKPAANTGDTKSVKITRNPTCTRKAVSKQRPSYRNASHKNYDTIYSWTDENGVKHYGNSKPKGAGSYKVMRMAKSQYKPKPKVAEKNYPLPTYTYAQNNYDTQNYQNVYDPPESEYGITRNELLYQIKEDKKRLESYKDRLSEEKKDLFDIKRKPYKARESERKRQRIKYQENVVESYERRINEVRERISKTELTVAHGKYDSD